MKKNIIILTKSDKRAGYCVAGIDEMTGEWIRIVSSNEVTEHAVPLKDMVCDNGELIEIYDVVEIDFLKSVATQVQPENYLYNESAKWKKKRKSSLNEVLRLRGCDNTEYVFGNENYRLTEDEVGQQEKSLLLLKVDDPWYQIKEFPERKVVQLNFRFKGINYRFFKITQASLKEKYLAYNEGQYTTGTQFFVFSLTDKYKDGKYYKVVAQALM